MIFASYLVAVAALLVVLVRRCWLDATEADRRERLLDALNRERGR